MGKLKESLNGIEVKQKIVTPVLANLTTALILFLVALIFKPIIVSLFSSNQVNGFPIFCILEPYRYNGDSVAVDLFIINTLNEKQTNESLSDFIKLHSSGDNQYLNTDIHISKKNGIGEISSVIPDTKHNQGIGDVEVHHAGDNWDINIIEIDGKSMLKLTIFTSIKRNISSRGSQGSNPLQISYPGRS
jgi:hypothetical protein